MWLRLLLSRGGGGRGATGFMGRHGKEGQEKSGRAAAGREQQHTLRVLAASRPGLATLRDSQLGRHQGQGKRGASSSFRADGDTAWSVLCHYRSSLIPLTLPFARDSPRVPSLLSLETHRINFTLLPDESSACPGRQTSGVGGGIRRLESLLVYKGLAGLA